MTGDARAALADVVERIEALAEEMEQIHAHISPALDHPAQGSVIKFAERLREILAAVPVPAAASEGTADREALRAALEPLIGAHADIVANHLLAAGFRRPVTAGPRHNHDADGLYAGCAACDLPDLTPPVPTPGQPIADAQPEPADQPAPAEAQDEREALEQALRWEFWSPENGGQWPRITAGLLARLHRLGYRRSPDDLLAEGYAITATHHDPLAPGTAVLAWPGSREGSPFVTRTRGEVWSLGDGTRVVAVEGLAGGIALTHIDVLPVRAADAEGRGRSHATVEDYARATAAAFGLDPNEAARHLPSTDAEGSGR